MKIMIAGSTGFVGRNLTEYLKPRYDELYCPKRKELNLVDRGAVESYLAEHRFDAVIHCGVTLQSVEDNLKMYFNIERCSKHFGKMIVVGSGAEYGLKPGSSNLKESDFGKNMPTDIYGFSKYVIGKDVEAKHRNIYNLRVFGIYGKYEDYKHRFISNNICRVLAGLNISMKRNAVFDYLYVNDFSRILEMFIQKDPAQRSYNVCAGEGLELLTLAKLIQDIDGRGIPIDIKEEGIGRVYTGDNTLFLKEFGDFDFTPPREAVSELYKWYKDDSGIVLDPAIL